MHARFETFASTATENDRVKQKVYEKNRKNSPFVLLLVSSCLFRSLSFPGIWQPAVGLR
jgi:hypothetical protein